MPMGSLPKVGGISYTEDGCGAALFPHPAPVRSSGLARNLTSEIELCLLLQLPILNNERFSFYLLIIFTSTSFYKCPNFYLDCDLTNATLKSSL